MPHQQQTNGLKRARAYLMSAWRVCFADLSHGQAERSEGEREDRGCDRSRKRMCERRGGEGSEDYSSNIFTSEGIHNLLRPKRSNNIRK